MGETGLTEDYRIIKHLDKRYEPSAWTDSYLAVAPDGRKVIISYLDREKILAKHSFDMGADEEDEEKEEETLAKGEELYEKRVAQFRENAEWMKGVKHPGICEVFEVGFDKERNQHLIVREFLSNLPIDLVTFGMTPLQMLPLFIKVLEPLHFLHSVMGVLHLNIKPNRIAAKENEDVTYTVKLTDGGFAVPIDAEKRPAVLHGTASYMAREVALKKHDEIGIKSDLQSFGILMYQCVTEKLPFPARKAARGDAERLARIVRNEDLPLPPSAVNRECPARMEKIIIELLAREPKDRVYETAIELIETFRREFPEACEEQPVMERTISVSK